MELSPRKQAVLAAVTKAYIKTGEPVGSKALTALLKMLRRLRHSEMR